MMVLAQDNSQESRSALLLALSIKSSLEQNLCILEQFELSADTGNTWNIPNLVNIAVPNG